MNILLISPLIAPSRKPQVYNIGLGYIAASLLHDGHQVTVLDIEGYRLSKKEVVERVKASKCDAIGIGTLITAYNYVKWLVKTIRVLKPGVPIWMGNSIAATIPDIILNDMNVDVVVIGEGELTVRELASGKNLNEIHGIAFKKDGKIIKTPERELIKDLDSIPYPAWNLFPQKMYMNNNKGILPVPVAYVSTTRGCPYHCTYCYHPFQNRNVRLHSARRIVDELKILKKLYGIKAFICADDLFIVNKKRVIEFCNLLVQEKLHLKWTATGRVNLVDETLLSHMKSAGCVGLAFGIESGSQLILDNIKKQVKVQDAENTIKLCNRVGVHPYCSFMIGNVGETKKTVAETIHFICKNLSSKVSFFLATPYPETELYNHAVEEGKVPDRVKLFESYGEQYSNLLVNFTGMSDERLKLMKSKGEKIIRKHFYKRYPWQAIPFLKYLLLKAVQNKIKIKKILSTATTFLRSFL